MTEPDVALSDFALSFESLAFAAILGIRRGGAAMVVAWFVLYFVSAAVASACGGLVHGFFLDTQSWGRMVFWPAALLAIGLNSVAALAIAGWLMCGARGMRFGAFVAFVVFAGYAAIVIGGQDSFRVAVWMAAPAHALLLAALVAAHLRDRVSGALVAAAGVLTSMIAVAAQQSGIDIHARYFTHNALAHVVQGVALALFFLGALRMLGRSSVQPVRGHNEIAS